MLEGMRIAREIGGHASRCARSSSARSSPGRARERPRGRPAPPRRAALPPGRDLPDGHRRRRGRRRAAARARRRGAARGRRVDHAADHGRQHQRAGDHDRRAGGRPRQGPSCPREQQDHRTRSRPATSMRAGDGARVGDLRRRPTTEIQADIRERLADPPGVRAADPRHAGRRGSRRPPTRGGCAPRWSTGAGRATGTTRASRRPATRPRRSRSPPGSSS